MPLAESVTTPQQSVPSQVLGHKDGRGINVYHFSQLLGTPARTKRGELINVKYEAPWFYLTIDERIDIFKKCSDVFGIVTSRMNSIAGLEYKVVPDSEKEDKDAIILETLKAMYDDYQGVGGKFEVARGVIREKIKSKLFDILPDLSNFSSSLLRWKRRIKSYQSNKSHEIEVWLSEPNIHVTWPNFVKQYVFDLLIHGAVGVYKEDNINGKLDNVYVLPGGSIYPVRGEFVGGVNAFVQIIVGTEPQIYFSNEIAFDSYIPTSAFAYGMIPLDALINKISEKLLFDNLMAEQADGTKAPEKVVVFGDNSPFSDLDKDVSLPISETEQKRIEQVITDIRKTAIATLSGVGQPMVLDLTRADTMPSQMIRQTEIKKDIALVFNMSNMEINESGAEGTSGRATSESQERIEKRKGTYPIIQSIQNMFNNNIIPSRFGYGYSLELKSELDELEEITKYKQKLESGLYTVNEIRTKDLGIDPFKDEQFDKPKTATPFQPFGQPEE